MIVPEKCFKYKPEIKRLTKSNSIAICDRVIYIVKKDYNGKTFGNYCAYDYETKILLASHKDKEFLIKFLERQRKELEEIFNDKN